MSDDTGGVVYETRYEVRLGPPAEEESIPSTEIDPASAAPNTGYDPATIYEGLATGTWIEWGFETQVATPIDGSSALARKLSPFILRVIPPIPLSASGGSTGDGDFDPNLYKMAGATSVSNANPYRAPRTVIGADQTNTSVSLEQIVSAGRLLNTLGVGSTEEVSAITDIYTYADIAVQIQNMTDIPPLQLLVNPQELSINYASIQEYQNRSHAGYIFQRWGEGQPKLSIKGSTGSFITAAPPGSLPVDAGGRIWEDFQRADPELTVPTGVQWASRRDSAAWQNFMALYHFYRNGGLVYDTVRGNCAHLGVGAIAIDYDQWTYVGTIESFNFSFQEGLPHRVEWSLEFTVSEMYDHAVAPSYVMPMDLIQKTPSVSDELKRMQSAATADAARTESVNPTNLYIPDGIARPLDILNTAQQAPIDERGIQIGENAAAAIAGEQGSGEVAASGGAAVAARYRQEGVYPFSLLDGE